MQYKKSCNPRKNRSRYKILVTAGPTVEPIDPVRYISNFSTGKMGFEIAAEAARRGHDVRLVSGPATAQLPSGVRTEKVCTAREMGKAVVKKAEWCDCVIMAAAVCDFRPRVKQDGKIKKKQGPFKLSLARNPDILLGLGKSKNTIKIGFALETDKPLENGREKLNKKKLDLIVVNVKNSSSDPFGEGSKDFIILDKTGQMKKIRKKSKKTVASMIIREAERLLGGEEGLGEKDLH